MFRTGMKKFLAVLMLSALQAQAGKPEITVAMEAKSGKPVKAEELFTVANKTVHLVDAANNKIELAPYSVVEFDQAGTLKLLRGSAVIESRRENSLKTSTALVEHNGRVLVSYDHKEKSTSAFVLEGEARIINPNESSRSLRLERFRGATMEIGGVLPQMVRQLDLASLRSWMAGYAWPEGRVAEILRPVPEMMKAEKTAAPAHLRETRIEDYFSAIETADEFHQPDYYDRKFQDPDAAIAQANSAKSPRSRELSPEEAALISLPSTRIDLGFEFIRAEDKDRELASLQPAHPARSNAQPSRKPASVKTGAQTRNPAPKKNSDGLDPEVNEVLERLRSIQQRQPVISQVPAPDAVRGPASGGASSLVPDPVYDYSENF